MKIIDSSILQFLSTFYLTFHHCFYMQDNYRHLNVFVSKLSLAASTFTFFKSGNSSQNVQKLFLRNLFIYFIFNNFAILFDDSFKYKFKKRPFQTIFRWFSMSITLKNDTIDFLGKYNAHLWFLNNEFLLCLFTKVAHYNLIIATEIISSIVKIITYKDIPNELDIYESHEFEENISNKEHRRFLYNYNHSPFINAPAYLLGYIASKNGIILKSLKLPKIFDQWAIFSYLFHTQYVFKILPLCNYNPFTATIFTNISTFASLFVLKNIFKSIRNTKRQQWS